MGNKIAQYFVFSDKVKMTTLSLLRGLDRLQLGKVQQLALVRCTHTSPPALQQKSAIPDRAASHGYTPFKQTESKVEWALARVDDLVNWGRKVRKGRFFDIKI